MTGERFEIRPLARTDRAKGGGEGVWRSRDGRWTFLRHWSDPHPQRWFAYIDGDDQPANDGMGHVSLRAVAAWAEAEDPAEYTDTVQVPEQ